MVILRLKRFYKRKDQEENKSKFLGQKNDFFMFPVYYMISHLYIYPFSV